MSPRILRRITAGLAALSLGTGLSLAIVGSVAADVPSPPVGAFTADECEGTTDADPKNPVPVDANHHAGAVPDLTVVFGARLDAYNAGKLAVLYDTYGANDWRISDGASVAYPPLCVVRHVDGVGAVSEWMFCTDYFSHVCGGTDVDGRLMHEEGDPLAPLERIAANPKLSLEQERMISYLIKNGHTYSGTGYFAFGGTPTAERGLDSNARAALQVLVWCISDPVDPLDANPTEVNRATTCADNMSTAEQARILAMTPEAPEAQLAFDGQPGELAIGEIGEFVLSTNLYEQPITITLTRGAAVVTASGPGASLVGNQLTVSGSDPDVVTQVRLQVAATSAGHIGLSATATPASRTDLSWNQTPQQPVDGIDCQVFAKFDTVASIQLESLASTEVVADPELAVSGVFSVTAILGALAATLAGIVALMIVRRARSHA